MYVPSFIRTRLATLPASTVLIINVQAYGGSGEVEKPAPEVADYLASLQRGKVYALQVSIIEQDGHRRSISELVCWYHDDHDHHNPSIAADQDEHWHDWMAESVRHAVPAGWDSI